MGEAAREVPRGTVVAAALVIACGSAGPRFGPEADDRFVGSVVGTYVAGGGLSILLCEDATPEGRACTAGTGGDCPRECHAIRGGGAGKDETLDARGGCGRCGDPTAELSARVELTLADGSCVMMRGAVATAPTEADPNAGPIALRAAASEDHLAPSLSGELRGGRILARFSHGGAGVAAADGGARWPAGPDQSLAFTRTAGPEACR